MYIFVLKPILDLKISLILQDIVASLFVNDFHAITLGFLSCHLILCNRIGYV